MFFFKKITPVNLNKHATSSYLRIFRKFLFLPSILYNIYFHPLNKKNKILSIIKFFFFQIEMRIFKKKKIFKWVENSLVEVSLGDSSLIGNYYTGLIEFEPMSFLLHAHKPDYIFVDVGSNMGSYSILASAVIGSRSIAFEPNNEAYLKLIRQAKINNITHLISVKNIALGEKKEQIFFTNSRNELNRVAIPGLDTNDLERVKSSTLDSELDIKNYFIMKIDVEGFEMNVLKGGKHILKSKNLLALIIEINGFNKFYGIDEKDIHTLLLKYGFFLYAYDPFKKKFKRLDILKNNINIKRSDFIYIKNIKKIYSNVITSEKKIFHSNFGIYF